LIKTKIDCLHLYQRITCMHFMKIRLISKDKAHKWYLTLQSSKKNWKFIVLTSSINIPISAHPYNRLIKLERSKLQKQTCYFQLKLKSKSAYFFTIRLRLDGYQCHRMCEYIQDSLTESKLKTHRESLKILNRAFC
jgi:hypothetical protein